MKGFTKREKKMVTYFTWEYVLNIFYMIYTGCNMKKKTWLITTLIEKGQGTEEFPNILGSFIHFLLQGTIVFMFNVLQKFYESVMYHFVYTSNENCNHKVVTGK